MAGGKTGGGADHRDRDGKGKAGGKNEPPSVGRGPDAAPSGPAGAEAHDGFRCGVAATVPGRPMGVALRTMTSLPHGTQRVHSGRTCQRTRPA